MNGYPEFNLGWNWCQRLYKDEWRVCYIKLDKITGEYIVDDRFCDELEHDDLAKNYHKIVPIFDTPWP